MTLAAYNIDAGPCSGRSDTPFDRQAVRRPRRAQAAVRRRPRGTAGAGRRAVAPTIASSGDLVWSMRNGVIAITATAASR